MPQSFSLYFSLEIELGQLSPVMEQLIEERCGTLSLGDEGFALSGSEMEWYLMFDGYGRLADFALEESASNEDLAPAFREIVRQLGAYYVQFNHVDVARRFVELLAEHLVARRLTFWMDTEYGWVIDGPSILRELAANPEWDWRHPLPS